MNRVTYLNSHESVNTENVKRWHQGVNSEDFIEYIEVDFGPDTFAWMDNCFAIRVFLKARGREDLMRPLEELGLNTTIKTKEELECSIEKILFELRRRHRLFSEDCDSNFERGIRDAYEASIKIIEKELGLKR